MSSRHNSGSAPITSRIEWISFNGNEGENVTDFLHEVKHIALVQGRQRDEEWMSDYVESGGNALRWFTNFERDTAGSWTALRKALLDRFGPPDIKHILQAAPAEIVVNAASSSGRRVPNLDSTIEPLQNSIARLRTTSATSGPELQRQIDSATKSQVDLKRGVTDLETQMKAGSATANVNSQSQVNAGSQPIAEVQISPACPNTR
ncbi:hypothetical protein FRB96_004312 [Tulasnella sp. 330]|nr:hypothetical protein FRB96_004312 [Tulasnella sp. 330]KAG8877874.1 hypothetical protein FRB97_002945 [Tulasnella sp. 331]KAG8884286.1 hypothetical protein FRB98_002526 [Tulasnella sp. 332]